MWYGVRIIVGDILGRNIHGLRTVCGLNQQKFECFEEKMKTMRAISRYMRRAVVLVTAFSGLLSGMGIQHANGQATPGNQSAIEGTWQGTLKLPQASLRFVFKIEGEQQESIKSTVYSIDQSPTPLEASSSTFQDGVLKISIAQLGFSYQGRLSGDGQSIVGTFMQGTVSISFLLERSTPATAWTLPETPKALKPMAPDAMPTFEVATIKPSKPEEQKLVITIRGDRVITLDTSLVDLINFAYDVQVKQIMNIPGWAQTEKYDVVGKPDIEGTPNVIQIKYMVKQLLAERFHLRFHEDKNELGAYAIVVGKDGPKLTKSAVSNGALPSLSFRGLGVLSAQNSSIEDFADLMQSVVLDLPVVDQTGLTDHYDFLLKWAPDESQFVSLNVKIPPPSDIADAPPPLVTAMQEQLGLKLKAGKFPVKVLVVDSADHPSAN
jgi:uncharacterized protein (TIGR03435 family)